jgi:hypothetical protein
MNLAIEIDCFRVFNGSELSNLMPLLCNYVLLIPSGYNHQNSFGVFNPLFGSYFYTYLFYMSLIQITLTAFSLNLILDGDLSRKARCTAHDLITLFGVDGLLIEFDKCIIFFYVTNPSMMFWLVKDVVTYFSNITF